MKSKEQPNRGEVGPVLREAHEEQEIERIVKSSSCFGFDHGAEFMLMHCIVKSRSRYAMLCYTMLKLCCHPKRSVAAAM